MKFPTTVDYSLSLNDTSLIKGIAICFMLWHHLFYEHPEYGKLVHFSSQIGLICVSIFLFLSAYGLTIQFSKLSSRSLLNSIKFQVIRLMKFYANYWAVFIVVVPIGIFILGRSLEDAYSTNNVLVPFLRDILAINLSKSYNATWWFNTLIICCYLIFPIHFLFLKKSVLFILILFLFHLLPIDVGFGFVDVMKRFVLIFSLGIVYAMNVKSISLFMNKFKPFILISLLSIAFLVLSILRKKSFILGFDGMKIDPFLAIIVVLVSLIALRHIPCFDRIMQYLGKHSMNIYMTHTFIYHYFYSEFVYSFKYPIFIFVVLLGLSLGVSILLEYLKKMICFDHFIKKATGVISQYRVK